MYINIYIGYSPIIFVMFALLSVSAVHQPFYISICISTLYIQYTIYIYICVCVCLFV